MVFTEGAEASVTWTTQEIPDLTRLMVMVYMQLSLRCSAADGTLAALMRDHEIVLIARYAIN